MLRPSAFGTLVDLLRARADAQQERTALVTAAGEFGQVAVGYGDLDARARALAAHLRAEGVLPGQRALLLYPPGIEYVLGFLGCLYAGVVAVPLSPPNDRLQAERLWAVAVDAGATVALTDAPLLEPLRERMARRGDGPQLRLLATDGLPGRLAADWRPGAIAEDALAFLQYTSGSTATPKGVLVEHRNLMHNSAVIAELLRVQPDTRSVSWLPPYHDMGLIGGILQPLYSGFPGLLMPPTAFLREPHSWLRAISEFRATMSPAPNFGYAECVRRITDDQVATLDLSCWRRALVGAEPVRSETLDAFAARFAQAGFDPAAFLPCYGLAEATLFVAGFGRDEAPPAVRELDRAALAQDQVLDLAGGVAVVGCGGARGDRIAVVDPHTCLLCEPGAVGEVWISGDSVAAGYWNDEARTEQTFHAHLADDPVRSWLRSGDLGFLAGGELYLTGRLKDLIVVRGANHYPQDIELTAEHACAQVRAGRVAAFGVDGATGETVVLVCEAVPGADLGDAPERIAAAVSGAHALARPEVLLVRRGTLPLTSSGKIRRAECRARYLAGELPVLARTPAGPGTGEADPDVDPDVDPVERLIAESADRATLLRGLAARVLAREFDAVDPRRPLVAQGLDSLAASRLRADALAVLGVELDLAMLLGSASLADIGAVDLGAAAGPPVRRTATGDTAPATPGQQRLWMLHELGAGAAYHVAGTVPLPAGTELQPLREAVQYLVDRHEALRTGLRMTDKHGLEQFVVADVELDLPVLPVAGNAEEVTEEVRRWAGAPFALADPPLLRAAVFATGAVRMLALCVHHVVADGRSLLLLAAELGEHYSARIVGRSAGFSRSELRFRDFACWQRQLGGPAPTPHEAAGGTAPELFADPDDQDDQFAGRGVPVTLPADLVRRLRRLGASQQTTLFAVLAAGYATLLARWAGTEDVLFGTVSAGRTRRELADLVGFFAETVPLRVDLGGDPSFEHAVRRATLACLTGWQQPSGTEVHLGTAPRGADGHAVLRHLLVLQEARPEVRFGADRVPATPLPCGAKVDLELELGPAPDGGLTGTLSYATARLDEDTARRMARGFGMLLRAGVEAPQLPLSALPLMPDEDTEAVLAAARPPAKVCDAQPGEQAATALDWFAAVVAITPDAPAVIDPDGVSQSYAELDGAANRLARYLRSRGVRTEDRVGVHLPRGAALGVVVPAVLKAGGAYLPLDPDNPRERTAQLIADGAPTLVLTTAELAAGLEGKVPADRLVAVDTLGARLSSGDDAGPPEVAIDPFGAAYVLYTSGSTGRPKGAVNTHAALAARLRWAARTHGLGSGDRVLQKTSIGFDVSVWELLLPLVTGATLVFAAPGGHRDPDYLHRVFAERRITHCHFVPSMLREYLADPARRLPLRQLVCSGEALPAELATDVLDRFPEVLLLNLYGPTEAAIDVTEYPVRLPVPCRVPIGSPVPGTELYVLDEHLRPVPVGVPGQLFIGGAQLARGYLDQPGLTARRFLPSPFRAGARLYATGDLVRWRADLRLDYLRRLDDQLKIRGNRVEPGEVESVLGSHPAVRAAVVTGRRDSTGESYLVGYVVPADGAGHEPDGAEPDGAAELRAFLAARLPGYLVPAAFCRLAELPLLPSGKLDRAALPAVARANPATAAHLAPDTPVQRGLARIWSEVLGTTPVGRRDDFFELGGHSLMAVRIIGRVRAEFGVRLPVAAILGAEVTVERLAELVEQAQLDQAEDTELAELLRDLDDMTDAEVAEHLGEDR